MNTRSNLSIGAVVLALASSTMSIPHAIAADDVESVTSTDAEHALASVPQLRLETAAPAAATSASAAIVDKGDTMSSVPRDPREGLNLTIGTTSIRIGLPHAEGASAAVVLDGGEIAYPAEDGVANTVVPLADGLQVLNVIASPSAPTEYVYPLDIPPGATVSVVEDGSAIIADGTGRPFLTTTPPWAIDAAGAPVPTRYEIEGNRLVQIVDHTAEDFAYPVVADPTFTYWWGGKTWIPSNKVSVSLVSSALYALIPGFLGPAAVVGAGIGLCNQAGKGIWVYWTWGGHIWCTGP